MESLKTDRKTRDYSFPQKGKDLLHNKQKASIKLKY